MAVAQVLAICTLTIYAPHTTQVPHYAFPGFVASTYHPHNAQESSRDTCYIGASVRHQTGSDIDSHVPRFVKEGRSAMQRPA
jgi:hypothetical protein